MKRVLIFSFIITMSATSNLSAGLLDDLKDEIEEAAKKAAQQADKIKDKIIKKPDIGTKKPHAKPTKPYKPKPVSPKLKADPTPPTVSIGSNTNGGIGSDIAASRIFAGPASYPPNAFAAYGIVAFRAKASDESRERYINICRAYMDSILPSDELDVPLDEQMATVWPVDSEPTSNKLNSTGGTGSLQACEVAVDAYNLKMGQGSLKIARKSGHKLDGIGPYLLAWSPAAKLGDEKAIVLMADLSGTDTYEQARSKFLRWTTDIESNPELWDGGWNVEKVRLLAKNWLDTYGSKVLELIVPKKS